MNLLCWCHLYLIESFHLISKQQTQSCYIAWWKIKIVYDKKMKYYLQATLLLGCIIPYVNTMLSRWMRRSVNDSLPVSIIVTQIIQWCWQIKLWKSLNHDMTSSIELWKKACSKFLLSCCWSKGAQKFWSESLGYFTIMLKSTKSLLPALADSASSCKKQISLL